MSNTLPIKAVAYARISTLLKGQTVENQLVPIREFARGRGFEVVDEYIDEGISGARETRPALDQLVKDARRRKFKVVVVAALDRMSRSTKHMLTLLDELRHYGVSIISLRENLDFSSPAGQMALTVLSAVSALERQIISERIRVALATKKLVAQRSGVPWKAGRPTVATPEKAEQAQELRGRGLSIRKIAAELGVSRSSVQRMLEAVPGEIVAASSGDVEKIKSSAA